MLPVHRRCGATYHAGYGRANACTNARRHACPRALALFVVAAGAGIFALPFPILQRDVSFMIRLLSTTLVLAIIASLALRAQTPSLRVTPSPIVFGCTLAGEDSARTITVLNTGATAVTILEFVATPPFVAPTTRDVTLDPGAERPETIRFQPIAAPGNPTGTLTVRTPDGDLEVPLAGEVGVEPSIMPSMTSIDFFDVSVGSSKEICFVVRNPSCRPLDVVSILSDNPLFTITAGRAAPFVLGAFAEERYCVSFTPATSGDQSGRLTFEGDLGKRAVVRLSGRGVRSELAVDPSSVNFGTIDIGASSADAVVTIINRGTQTATIDPGMAVSGANPGDFVLTPPPLPIDIGPGESVPMRVRFRPTALGPRSARIVVNNSSDVDPVIDLRGVGSTFDVVVAPTMIDMGDVYIGSSRTALDTIVVDNRSTRTVSIVSTSIQGADPGAFAVLGFVVVPIAAGTDYKLDIRFAPDAVRIFTAELVGTLDNGTTFHVLLRGRGLDTASPRPRRIDGDTITARVGERRAMHFSITPPLEARDGVTRLFLRARLDPLSLYPWRVAASQATSVRSYTGDGIVEVTISGQNPLELDGFDLELEGLFTGRARNVVVIDSVALDDPRIGVVTSQGMVALAGCDIDRADTLLRVARISALWPNPSTGAMSLTYRSSSPATLRMMSIDGRVLATRALPGTGGRDARIDLDVDAGAHGIVVVELIGDDMRDHRILQVAR
jgi:hypothetical protein